MTAAQHMQRDYRREWLRVFHMIAQRHGEGKVFQDFVLLSSCLLSNVLDIRSYDRRYAEYLRILRQYTTSEVAQLSELQRLVYEAYQENPEQDFLGPLYEATKLSSDQLGQYFTPYASARVLASITLHGWSASSEEYTFSEPSGGSGAFPIAVWNEYRRRELPAGQLIMHVQDIDPVVARMCYIQLAMIRCTAVVSIGDSISTDCGLWSSGDKWFTPEYFGHTWMTRRIERGWLALEG